jgi:hypothetical protein
VPSTLATPGNASLSAVSSAIPAKASVRSMSGGIGDNYLPCSYPTIETSCKPLIFLMSNLIR